MKERLDRILKHYKLNSSRLAEMIDVQRSGISHILSGRNNPSYDFLLRILSTFPEIEANWLLTGKGEMIKGDKEAEEITVNKSEGHTASIPYEPEDTAANTNSQNEFKFPESQDDYKSKQDVETNKSIEKVIVLYSDGKFKEYRTE